MFMIWSFGLLLDGNQLQLVSVVCEGDQGSRRRYQDLQELRIRDVHRKPFSFNINSGVFFCHCYSVVTYYKIGQLSAN